MKKDIKKFFKINPNLKIKPRELAKRMGFTDPESYASIKQILFKLNKQGFLDRQGKRYFYSSDSEENLIGIFQLARDRTFGFVVLQNLNIQDIFIAERHFMSAVNGDKVRVELLPKRRGKNVEGKIVEIMERKHAEVIGDVVKRKNAYFVYPDEDKSLTDIYIPNEHLNGAKNGDKVVVTEVDWESKGINPEGKILEILGTSGTYEVQDKLILKEFDIPLTFPSNVLEDVANISDSIPEGEIRKRLDLRDDITFTIDPEDAKDFDDAVSVKQLEDDHLEVGIHIADVSHYMSKRSPVYIEASKRATSVYLVGNVVPMLPEKLSNNICSLVPYKDRLTYSVIVKISATGRILQYDIKKSVINSKRRFTYEEAQQVLEKGEGDFSEQLIQLNTLAKVLRAKRMKKGSINFITPEVKFELSEDGIPLNIKLKTIVDSNKLIEEFMLLANQIVAKHITKISGKNLLPFVYRIHDEPEEEKMRELGRFVNSLGYKFSSKTKNKSKEIQKLLSSVENSMEESVVNVVAIRSMAKAVYSADNIGHYGLGFTHYSHFTSPIRRFPDLVIHKLLYKYLENESAESYSKKELDKISNHSSNQERNAISAERLSVKLKQIDYLSNKIGYEFDGIISGVTNFGIFVELCDTLSEGLIKLRDMEDDYYVFDEQHYAIIGKVSKQKYRLGDKVRVKLIRIDKERREVDFILV
jgi:ribonuclease R